MKRWALNASHNPTNKLHPTQCVCLLSSYSDSAAVGSKEKRLRRLLLESEYQITGLWSRTHVVSNMFSVIEVEQVIQMRPT